jgi:hypothetical protein
MNPRIAEKQRTTKETDIRLRLNLDGTGQHEIATGIPFFDHMLAQLARHGRLDLEIAAKGDLEIDGHHTVEDLRTRMSLWTRHSAEWSWTFPVADSSSTMRALKTLCLEIYRRSSLRSSSRPLSRRAG